ncbi:hypothetical protein CBL_11219 [Carabus blaptoides fortunei]
MSLVTVLEFGNRHKSLSVASLVRVTYRYYTQQAQEKCSRRTSQRARSDSILSKLACGTPAVFIKNKDALLRTCIMQMANSVFRAYAGDIYNVQASSTHSIRNIATKVIENQSA